jgi:hypothetical protein
LLLAVPLSGNDDGGREWGNWFNSWNSKDPPVPVLVLPFVPVIHNTDIRHILQLSKLLNDTEEDEDVREKSLRAGRVVILFAAIVEEQNKKKRIECRLFLGALRFHVLNE